jgi:hypothetical protein
LSRGGLAPAEKGYSPGAGQSPPAPVHFSPSKPSTFSLHPFSLNPFFQLLSRGLRIDRVQYIHNAMFEWDSKKAESNEKTIRLISARLANRKEKKRYQEAED